MMLNPGDIVITKTVSALKGHSQFPQEKACREAHN